MRLYLVSRFRKQTASMAWMSCFVFSFRSVKSWLPLFYLAILTIDEELVASVAGLAHTFVAALTFLEHFQHTLQNRENKAFVLTIYSHRMFKKIILDQVH